MMPVPLKPLFYLIVVLCGLLIPFAFKLRSEGIFACPANGYSENKYLAYCHVRGYADYDHGAIWFNLEPTVERHAAEADVLFLGNSKMQFGFSSRVTEEFFSSAAARYYLLGFSSTENMTFTAPLLSRIRPRARVYVINVDRFFEDRETNIGNEIIHAGDAIDRTKAKRYWQFVHRPLCSTLPVVCGTEASFFRYRETGSWEMRGIRNWGARPVSMAPADEVERWTHFTELGRQFRAQLPVEDRCLIFTTVPSAGTKQSEAATIVRAMGFDLIAPDIDNLMTFDGLHLDSPSAERWSRAFFEMAGPRIRACLDQSTVSPVHIMSAGL